MKSSHGTPVGVVLALLFSGCNQFSTTPLDAMSGDLPALDVPDHPEVSQPDDRPPAMDGMVVVTPDVPSPDDGPPVDGSDGGPVAPDAPDGGTVLMDAPEVGVDAPDGGSPGIDVQPDHAPPQDRLDVFDSGCLPTETLCAGACANLQTSALHCGACGTLCGAGQGCVAGVCQIVCGPGTTNCSGVCRDTSVDRSHCGRCGVTCGMEQRCVAGTCQDPCPTGTLQMQAVTFGMGTAEVLTGPARDQNPQHPVTLRPYCLGRLEVTLEEYRRCVTAGRCTPIADRDNRCNWNNSGREQHPINCIDYSQAVSVCAFLYAGGRLPTEAEWENAASVQGSRLYPWVSGAPSQQLCWSGGPDGQRTSTCPVGERPSGNTPSSHSDLAGNVWEMVSDWYGPYSEASQTDPTGPNAGTERVHRGGTAFGTNQNDFTSRVRGRQAPTDTAYYLGVRCAADPNAPTPTLRVRVAASSQSSISQGGTTDLVSRACASGEVLLSGGCGTSSPDNILLTTGAPVDVATAWNCYGRSNGQIATLQAFAMCSDTPGIVVRRVVGATVMSGTGTAGSVGPAEARCQTGETLVGGGCQVRSSSVALSSSFPIDGENGWRCGGRFSGSGDSSLTAYALCLNRVLPVRVVQASSSVAGAGGQVGTLSARCARGETMLGGGCRSSDSLLQLSANHPADVNSWSCRGNWGGTGGSPVLTSHALCVASTSGG